ncbi:DUF1684 domain-containing protein [Leucobacter sp. GX24907]
MQHTAPLSFADAHAAWHAHVETQRAAPHGPLSVTALHWLTAEPQTFPDLPGQWSADPGGRVTAWFVSKDGITIDGSPALGEVTVGPLTGTAATTLGWGAKRIELARRGDRVALRPRDPESRDRTHYRGTPTFPPDPAWVVTARYTPGIRPGIEVDSAADGLRHRYDSPGSAQFEVDGQEVSLTLFGETDARELLAIFSDATAADLSYPAARFVPAIRADDGTVVIDFNRTTNPPCAYSASATCPFPPTENRLPVRIEAGELRPR